MSLGGVSTTLCTRATASRNIFFTAIGLFYENVVFVPPTKKSLS